jgi:hypothetical protein
LSSGEDYLCKFYVVRGNLPPVSGAAVWTIIIKRG